MALVHIKDLWVTYGAVHAVRGISFDIPKGEVFGFIGPNGAGKTSTIKVLSTLIKPDYGLVTIGGISVTDDPLAIRKRIGYMPDFFGVYEDLTANEYLHFFAAAYDIPASQRERTVGDVLALTDLTAKAGEPVDALSRGMKQRLGLARVLLHDPDLLLLDEPASGLDPRARIEMREMLLALKEMGKTIIMMSTYPENQYSPDAALSVVTSPSLLLTRPSATWTTQVMTSTRWSAQWPTRCSTMSQTTNPSAVSMY